MQQESGLPLLKPVDSVPQWQHILEDTNGRPGPLHLSKQAVLTWPFKLVTGRQVYSSWQGELFPNCSTIRNLGREGPVVPYIALFGVQVPPSPNPEEVEAVTQVQDCGFGCLFDVARDPGEHHNLASASPSILRELQAALWLLNEDSFQPDRGTPDREACATALEQGGFYGPFVDTEDFYQHPRPKQSPEQDWTDERTIDYLAFRENFLRSPKEALSWFRHTYRPTKTLLNGDALDKCLSD
mmetsp:Transcript_31388/g.90047  ORF Transcript_31388/g.90047 Transcript_31388/m.90047 type:complete len:241 (+) Transcript_31388:3-725(+)